MPHQAVGTILRLSHEGRGVTTSSDGRVTFVAGALPGEDITWQVVRGNKNYIDAKVVNITNKSSDRISPKCSKFLVCGGCSLQHLSPDKQLEFKAAIVAEQLKHFGGVVAQAWLPAIRGENFGYRYKARLGVRYSTKTERAFIGFREQFSSYVTDINYCEVLHPRIAAL